MNATVKTPIVILTGEAAKKILNRPQNLERQAEAVKKAREQLRKAGYKV